MRMHIGDLLFISFSSSNVLFCFVCRNRTLNSLAPLFFYRIAFSSVTLYFCLFLCVCVLLLFRCMMLFTGKAIGITSKIFPFYSSRSVRFAFLTHFPIRKVKLAFFLWYRCRIAVATIATISIPSLSPQFYLQTKLTQFKRFRIPNICKYLLNINRHNRFRWNIVRIAQVVMCLCAEWVEVKTCSTTSKHTNSLDTSSIFIYAIWQ